MPLGWSRAVALVDCTWGEHVPDLEPYSGGSRGELEIGYDDFVSHEYGYGHTRGC